MAIFCRHIEFTFAIEDLRKKERKRRRYGMEWKNDRLNILLLGKKRTWFRVYRESIAPCLKYSRYSMYIYSTFKQISAFDT